MLSYVKRAVPGAFKVGGELRSRMDNVMGKDDASVL